MIQRIQTVYLFLIVVLQSFLLSSNIAKYIDSGGTEFVRKTMEFTPMAILAALTSLIPAFSLFLYKKRTLQMRFNIFNSILLVALQLYILYYLVSFMGGENLFKFSIASIFPALSLILSILAVKKIFKDEILIKSLNRLRK